MYVLFLLSFVAKWSFLTLAQLTKLQGLGFGVALFCVQSELVFLKVSESAA